MFVYTEFTKKKVFEQLTLAVACSASCRPASGEVSISKCDATWRKVEVMSYQNLNSSLIDPLLYHFWFVFWNTVLLEHPPDTQESIFCWWF